MLKVKIKQEKPPPERWWMPHLLPFTRKLSSCYEAGLLTFFTQSVFPKKFSDIIDCAAPKDYSCGNSSGISPDSLLILQWIAKTK